MKIKDPVVAWLVRNCDRVETFSDGPNAYLYGSYCGRKVRYAAHQEARVDIGDGDFDRWANSQAVSFKPSPSSFPQQMRRAVSCAMALKKNCTYIDLDAIGFSNEVAPEEFRKSLFEAEAAA